MRLHLLSDLHTEFGPPVMETPDADVTLLAGDISLGLRGLDFIRTRFPNRPVLYIAGNHEYYGHSIPHLTHKLRDASRGTSIHFLEDDQVILGHVRFLGCTLWTDFCLFGPDHFHSACEEARASMTDFRRIRRSPTFRRFTPRDAAHFHQASRLWLGERLAEPFAGPTVVMTHHAPSPRSLHPQHQPDLLSAAYASDLSPLLDGRATLWVHGHTHHCVDYTLNGTRILANQHGYPGELSPGFRPGLTIDL